ncbi:MAG: hypothetical protein A2498_09500 [Lentisphaerae bacterium RIFOXYC12_FULL_60_16]|nr:MAG: hypothetical protein A2498_09500 [Lentisphaerae bacterium RIFOXYC12_FULL_60_16]OGV73028.1 MAG: hypothetical protein A2269_06260 [Lentisphaerae bacterium RIFOXYA12_FULL_60_10]OGV75394.1 MAG: hypothetical protein A2340_13345 [Lentisphaerae bacterium RIFOXYB12_FULL_60_10]
MTELLNNPITIIAGILALSFFIIGYGRRWVAARNQTPAAKEGKPYQVTSPYETPAERDQILMLPTPPAPSMNATDSAHPPRYFKQFGSAETTGESTPDTSGYVWE